MTQARGRNPDLVAKGWRDTRGGDREHVRRMQLYMTASLFDRLQRIAKDNRMPLSATVRGLVCDGLAARQTGESSHGALK
jgi:hypothetical protein